MTADALCVVFGRVVHCCGMKSITHNKRKWLIYNMINIAPETSLTPDHSIDLDHLLIGGGLVGVGATNRDQSEALRSFFSNSFDAIVFFGEGGSFLKNLLICSFVLSTLWKLSICEFRVYYAATFIGQCCDIRQGPKTFSL